MYGFEVSDRGYFGVESCVRIELGVCEIQRCSSRVGRVLFLQRLSVQILVGANKRVESRRTLAAVVVNTKRNSCYVVLFHVYCAFLPKIESAGFIVESRQIDFLRALLVFEEIELFGDRAFSVSGSDKIERSHRFRSFNCERIGFAVEHEV